MIIFDPVFLAKLDELVAAFPNCSCRDWGRSVTHNEEVGGAPHSLHRLWCAVDLTFDGNNLLDPTRKALDLGFGGIELDLTNFHLHLDNRTTIWHVVKTVSGEYIPLDQFLKTGGEPR